MRSLLAFPVLILAIILQTAVIARMPLLAGVADLMLLVLAAWSLQEGVTTSWHWAVLGGFLAAFVSAVPWVVYLGTYLAVVAFGQVLRRRVWQAPLLAMFALTFAGTLLLHTLSFIVLSLLGNPLPLGDSFFFLTVPSLLLNMALALLVYPLMRDLAAWAYRPEVAQ